MAGGRAGGGGGRAGKMRELTSARPAPGGPVRKVKKAGRGWGRQACRYRGGSGKGSVRGGHGRESSSELDRVAEGAGCRKNDRCDLAAVVRGMKFKSSGAECTLFSVRTALSRKRSAP